jgi:hypothetical protein
MVVSRKLSQLLRNLLSLHNQAYDLSFVDCLPFFSN